MDRTQLTTTIHFVGKDVHALLAQHPIMGKAICDLAHRLITERPDATITVHPQPRLEPHAQLEWPLSITSPTGRSSYSLVLRNNLRAPELLA